MSTDSTDEPERLTPQERIELGGLAIRVAQDALAKLSSLHEEGHQFKDGFSWYPVFAAEDPPGTYRRVKSGSSTDGPRKYEAVIGTAGTWGTVFSYDDLDGFAELMKFISARPSLATFLAPERFDADWRTHILRVNAADLPLTIAQRHIVDVGWIWDSEHAEGLLQQMINWWSWNRLPVEVLVPILNVDFESDEFQLDQKSRVERMSDGLRRARWPGHPQINDHSEVFDMATHCLVLTDYSFSNLSAMAWLQGSSNDPVDVPQADQFFSALNAITSEPTGYAQICYRPLLWAHRLKADLPTIEHGPILRRYPASLNQSLEPGTTLDATEIVKLQSHYLSVGHENSRLTLAATRLRDSSLRQAEVDRLLDLCIGLEALVAGEPGDATFKLATRATAVLASRGIGNVADFFTALKTIYAYRSALVHGRGKPTKSAIVSINGSDFSTVSVAAFVLREVLQSALDDPSLTASAIDSRLILPALASLSSNMNASEEQSSAQSE